MPNPSRRILDLSLTAFAPLVWGTTYLVTTQALPPDRPLTAALLRTLPIGVLLLVANCRQAFGPWLTAAWLGRLTILGLLNIGLFQALLFVGAYRLPGGVAATLGAIQPLLVAGLAWPLLGLRPQAATTAAGLAGLAGVALLVLTPAARLNGLGIAAALAGTVFMAVGTLLARRWAPPVPAVVFSAWQLAIGGLALIPPAVLAEPSLPPLSAPNVAGYLYLGLVGTGLAYALWFRGVIRLHPSAVASLGLLSPLSATLLGWLALGQTLSLGQTAGAAMVLAAVWLGQTARVERP